MDSYERGLMWIAASGAAIMAAFSVMMTMMLDEGRKREACIDTALAMRVSIDPCFPAEFIAQKKRDAEDARRKLEAAAALTPAASQPDTPAK